MGPVSKAIWAGGDFWVAQERETGPKSIRMIGHVCVRLGREMLELMTSLNCPHSLPGWGAVLFYRQESGGTERLSKLPPNTYQ